MLIYLFRLLDFCVFDVFVEIEISGQPSFNTTINILLNTTVLANTTVNGTQIISGSASETPEFPSAILLVILALVVVVAVMVMRKKNYLFFSYYSFQTLSNSSKYS